MTPEKLQVPDEFSEWFRLAVMEEIKNAADAIGQLPAEYALWAKNQPDREAIERCVGGNLDDSRALLDECVQLLRTVGLTATGPIKEGIVSHQFRAVCETMASAVIAPRIEEALFYSPPMTGDLRRLSAAMTWAMDQVDRLDAEAVDEGEAVAA
jgi:hypothetical protein